jgi:hypothetical protein
MLFLGMFVFLFFFFFFLVFAFAQDSFDAGRLARDHEVGSCTFLIIVAAVIAPLASAMLAMAINATLVARAVVSFVIIFAPMLPLWLVNTSTHSSRAPVYSQLRAALMNSG